MPPKKRQTVALEKTEDGRILHRFRQSTVGTLEQCLEKGRLQITNQLPRIESDATAVGTSVHEGIEVCLQDLRDEGSPANLDVIQEIAHQAFDELSAAENFQWKQLSSDDEAYAAIDRCLAGWYEEILPRLNPVAMEIPFENVVVYEDDNRVITIEGTMDYLDRVYGVGDWKTGNQKYKAWEKDRWNIQATVYLYAALKLGLIEGTEFPFTFYVMLKKGPDLTQQVKITRNFADFSWLSMKLKSYALLFESRITEWPRNDTSALCSPKWCEAWTECKGHAFAYPDAWPDNRTALALERLQYPIRLDNVISINTNGGAS